MTAAALEADFFVGYLFVLTQFRTENRFTLFLELRQLPALAMRLLLIAFSSQPISISGTGESSRSV